uniref:NADH-ubiquinone oxidoreductase chain 4L n=1 Tax=Obscurella hidalgoi TaxID=1663726 RepID=A0A0M3WMS8_OBSHI|nr:NADH dehydrogenase subunit 4L [Obscurella hidalgoi]AKL90685.1 NADH dehydrogenase subunit 4L [Obscurella hidalgoi]
MSIYLSAVSVLSFFMALLALGFQHKHLLGVLLALEAATMSLFIFLFSISVASLTGEASLILITLGACEASLGLSILVSATRSWGNDYVSSFTMQKC